jgi:hypothetical protein
MLTPIAPLLLLLEITWARLQAKRADDRGITTEVMIVTAILAAVALTVVGFIATAINNKGHQIEGKITTAGNGR